MSGELYLFSQDTLDAVQAARGRVENTPRGDSPQPTGKVPRAPIETYVALLTSPLAAVAFGTVFTVNSATWSSGGGGVATYGTTSAHGYTVGRLVRILFVGAFGSLWDGGFIITSVPTSTSFTVSMPSNPGATAITGASKVQDLTPGQSTAVLIGVDPVTGGPLKGGSPTTVYNLGLAGATTFAVASLVRNALDGLYYVQGFQSGTIAISLLDPASVHGSTTGSAIVLGDTGQAVPASDGGGHCTIPNASLATNGLVKTNGPSDNADQTWQGPKRVALSVNPSLSGSAGVPSIAAAGLGGLTTAAGRFSGFVATINSTASGYGAILGRPNLTQYPWGGIFCTDMLDTFGNRMFSDTLIPVYVYARSWHADGIVTDWDNATTSPTGAMGGVAMVLDPDRAELGVASAYSNGHVAFAGDTRVAAATRDRLPSRFVVYEFITQGAGQPASVVRREGVCGRLSVTIGGVPTPIKITSDSYSGDPGGDAYVSGGIIYSSAGVKKQSTSLLTAGKASAIGTGTVAATVKGITVPAGSMLAVTYSHGVDSGALAAVTGTFAGNPLTLDDESGSVTASGVTAKVGTASYYAGVDTTGDLAISFSAGGANGFLLITTAAAPLATGTADKHVHSTGTSTVPITGVTAATTTAVEHAQAAFVGIGAPDSVPDWDLGFESQDSMSVLFNSVQVSMLMGYKHLIATGTPDAALTATYPAWAGVLQTYA